MKFSCDQCGRTYVADDKVRGRAFKMKCKQCGHLIVVRAASDAASAAEPGAAARRREPGTQPVPLGGPAAGAALASASNPFEALPPPLDPFSPGPAFPETPPATAFGNGGLARESTPPPTILTAPPETAAATATSLFTAPIANDRGSHDTVAETPPPPVAPSTPSHSHPSPALDEAEVAFADLTREMEISTGKMALSANGRKAALQTSAGDALPPLDSTLSEASSAAGTSAAKITTRPAIERATPKGGAKRSLAPAIAIGLLAVAAGGVGWMVLRSSPEPKKAVGPPVVVSGPHKPAPPATAAARSPGTPAAAVAASPAPSSAAPAPLETRPAAPVPGTPPAPVAGTPPTSAKPPAAAPPPPVAATPAKPDASAAAKVAAANAKRDPKLLPRRDKPIEQLEPELPAKGTAAKSAKATPAKAPPAKVAAPLPSKAPEPAPLPSKAPPAVAAVKPAPAPASVPSSHGAQATVSDVSAEPASAGGTVPLEDAKIESIIAQNTRGFQTCVEAARTDDPGVALDGRRVVITMTVNPTGKAIYPTLDDAQLSNTSLGKCLKREAGKIAFPAFAGDPVRVRVPLTLR